MKHKEKLFAEVLQFCNEVREKLGLDPVNALEKGKRNHYCQCPVSNTINKGFGGFVETEMESVRIQSKGIEVANPYAVIDFLENFDRNQFPELIG